MVITNASERVTVRRTTLREAGRQGRRSWIVVVESEDGTSTRKLPLTRDELIALYEEMHAELYDWPEVTIK